jgi:hypothetical protein
MAKNKSVPFLGFFTELKRSRVILRCWVNPTLTETTAKQILKSAKLFGRCPSKKPLISNKNRNSVSNNIGNEIGSHQVRYVRIGGAQKLLFSSVENKRFLKYLHWFVLIYPSFVSLNKTTSVTG